MNKRTTYLILFLIIALGFFLRIYNIESAPPGVYPDEAVNGEDAIRAIATGNYQWFYPANNGREGLFMNFIAFCFKLFGISVLSLKLPSIIFGTLTIWGTYLVAKEVFKKERIGLIAAFLVSVSFWAMNFSRISFRAVMLPFILVFSFYFLLKGIRTNKFLPFAIGGFIFGAGLHTYIAFRVAPAILVFLLISYMLTTENFLKIYWKKILIFILFAAISAMPIIYTFYSHPEYLESRSANISILSPEVNQGKIIQTFLRSFGMSLVKYNFWGDQNWRHNFPPYPVLDPLTGIMFLAGFIFSVFKFFQLLGKRFLKKVKNPDLNIYILLVSWFFFMLVPEFMTSEGLPHALRSIGTLPVVIIFAAMVFNYLIEKMENFEKSMKRFACIFAVSVFVFIGIFNTVKYHVVWANRLETAQSFEKVLMETSDYIRAIHPGTEIYVITGSMQRVPIKVFNSKLDNVRYLYESEIDQIQPRKLNNFQVIMTNRNDEIIEKLENKFPNSMLITYTDSIGISFYTFIPKK